MTLDQSRDIAETVCATLLAASIFADGPVELHRAMQAAIRQGAEAAEVRLDLCTNIGAEDLQSLREGGAPSVPLILAIRSAAEGGAWDGDDDERVSKLIELGPLFDYIDVELSLWRRSANIRKKVGLALQRTGHFSEAGGRKEVELAGKRKLILSKHDQATRPTSLHADFLEMLSTEPCAVPKVAWRARTVRDNFEAFELMRTSPRPAIVICMGDDGQASRALARKFGAFATFASVRDHAATAAGQLTVEQMRSLSRWGTVNGQTHVYGLVGDPVAHSLSPRIHNAGFAALGENAVYLPFRVEASYESFKAFMVEVLARPWMDFRGLSVTAPHKENALRFLLERGGQVDAVAQRFGAVNTLVLPPGGGVNGINTDQPAALEAVCLLRNCGLSELVGKRVAVLGAGGVARAVVSGLCDAGANVTVYNRTRPRAEVLASAFGCRVGDWEQRTACRAWLLVNCTSIGMHPNDAASPMPDDSLGGFEAVLDTVYSPRQTRLIQQAQRRGLPAAGGLEMFLGQAGAQFAAWTGKPAPRDEFRRSCGTAAPRCDLSVDGG